MKYELEAYDKHHAEDIARELFARDTSFVVRRDAGYRPDNGVGYADSWMIAVEPADREALDAAYDR